jgi:hypothetical protein
MLLKGIFSGKVKDKNVIVHKKLTFVEHFKEPKFRQLFYPVTVEGYLKMNALIKVQKLIPWQETKENCSIYMLLFPGQQILILTWQGKTRWGQN